MRTQFFTQSAGHTKEDGSGYSGAFSWWRSFAEGWGGYVVCGFEKDFCNSYTKAVVDDFGDLAAVQS